MSETLHAAECASCGKQFRVPNPEKSYRCKACGGAVRAATNADSDPEGVSCPECGIENPGDNAFCEDCGASLEGPASETSTPAGSRPRSPRARAQRRDAAWQLRSSLKFVKIVRGTFLVFAIGHGLMTLSLVTQVGDATLDLRVLGLVIGVYATMTALLVAGYFQVLFRPFFWTALLAALQTLVAVLRLATDGPGASLLFPSFLAVSLWGLAGPLSRTRRLIQENPDLYVSQRIQGAHRDRHRRREGGAREARASLKAAGARAWRVSLLSALAVYAVTGAGSWAVYASERAEAFEPAVQSFHDAWAASDEAALGTLFGPTQASEQSSRLVAASQHRGWSAGLPVIESWSWEQLTETRGIAHFDCGEFEVRTRWALVDRTWRLEELRLPPPPIDALGNGLVAAWEANDLAAIARLFGPSRAFEKTLGSLERMRERYEWGDPLVAIVDVRLQHAGGEAAAFLMRHERGSVTWQARVGDDDQWWLTSVRGS